MFDYPIPKTTKTLYHRLHLSLDASKEQISKAITKLQGELKQKNSELAKKLDIVYSKIPEIREQKQKSDQFQKEYDNLSKEIEKAKETFKNSKSEAQQEGKQKINQFQKEKDDKFKEIEKLNATLEKLEGRALQIEPQYLKMIEEMERINKEIVEINNIKLEKPEEKERYDLSTPPCALLHMIDMSIPMFQNTRATHFVLRKEMDAFLEEEKQISSYHPTDLTRTYFTSDFYRLELLDGV